MTTGKHQILLFWRLKLTLALLNICSKRELYWADALEDRIEVSNFDGGDRKQIVEHTAHPFSIALYESNLYWSNWYNKSIWRVSKLRKKKNKPQEIRSGLGGALDIRAVSASRQPHQWSPCMERNGDCTHLCLYRYTSYVCECPDRADSRSCIKGIQKIITLMNKED